ncbi:hypothetical protein LTR36_001670 [Oleoguttula mirabilis]|uniref:EF-hand domain-containing protein n=1 Tax=Oleoguttula mirabilis TaxID=1507867 RepID=A0AAV9JNK5_9PEZI|nr:hypothetical protein LTR36_001670 [Oleoguttula mirabilis]
MDNVASHEETASAKLVEKLSVALRERLEIKEETVPAPHTAKAAWAEPFTPGTWPRPFVVAGDGRIQMLPSPNFSEATATRFYLAARPDMFAPHGLEEAVSRDKETWLRRLYLTGNADPLVEELLEKKYVVSEPLDSKATQQSLSELFARSDADNTGSHNAIDLRLWLQYFEYTAGFAQLFCTDIGLLGLGAGTVKADDAVILLRGSRLPVILRPLPGPEADPPGYENWMPSARTDHWKRPGARFRFMGFAYLSGADALGELEMEQNFTIE